MADSPDKSGNARVPVTGSRPASIGPTPARMPVARGPSGAATPGAGRPPAAAVPDVLTRADLAPLREILPTLIDALSDAVVVVDRERRMVAANRRYVEAFGVRKPELVGLECHEALACREDARVTGSPCGACDAIQSKRPGRLLRTRTGANGQQRRWEVSFNPALGPDGEVSHVVEVWRDVSERRKLESQLAHSERLASLGQLAAGVGHEINNPLASLLAGIESLQRWLVRREFDQAGVADASETLALLEREARRCRETTDKLMLLAQPVQTAPTHMDLNVAVSDTLSLLNYQMRRQGVNAVEELDPALPPIWARASGIRGVCMNLMLNAVQAMPQGGALTVRTRFDGQGVTLEIEDTGRGIEAADLDRIWDPFFTTKPVGQGTGLGLSITQRVVSRHGGRVRVESRPGEGARFIVWLPFAGPGGDGV
jgi:two-component system, NtrC family, sensor kinase